MKKKFEKFVKNLENLDNYYILIKQPNYIVVGTKLLILKKLRYVNGFTRSDNEREIELPVFFLVKTTNDSLDMEKFFLKNELSILDFDKPKHYLEVFGHDKVEMNLKETEMLLGDFIKKTFLE